VLTILFLHGWGFDRTVWTPVAERLEGFRRVFCDRGYFEEAAASENSGPVLAAAHSFGAMQLLSSLPEKCVGIAAINGFDRFAADAHFPGVPTRVLDRMIARFAKEPRAVLAEFREKCGSTDSFGAIDTRRLSADLGALRSDDRREETARFAGPILSLGGDADPILSPAMQEAVFASADDVMRESVAGGGHLLPLTHPGLCAERISAMAKMLP